MESYKIDYTIGYKIAYAGTIKVLITLQIPSDALTNAHRPNIIDPQYAKYRANKVFVVSIIDYYNKEHMMAKSGFYAKKLVYVKNQFVCSEFNPDINIVCGEGIHYFLDKYLTINYKVPILKQYWDVEYNMYKEYYNNGQLSKKIKYIMDPDDNKLIIYKHIWEYYNNGNNKLDYNLHINKYDGVYKEWYENGNMKKKLKYDNNKIISYVENWNKHGSKI